MQFSVIAIDGSQREQRIVLDASDADAARRAAARDGWAVLDVAPRRRRRGWGQLFRGAARFSLDLFCLELLAMVQAGVPIREALQSLATKEGAGARIGTGEAPAGQGVIARLLRAVEEGRPLSFAMAAQPDVFAPLLTETMRAAERTSDYEPALTRFVAYRRLAKEMRGKLVAAALYPMILLAVSGLVLTFLIGYVVPRFALVYEDLGDRVPPASRLLLTLGTALAAHPALSACVAAGVAMLAMLAWRAGAGQAMLLTVARMIPRFRDALATVQMARLYRTLALLLSGGLPMVASLDLAAGVLPAATAPRLHAAQKRISEGQPFSRAFNEQGLSTVVADRFFRVGEQTGRLAEMVDRAADFHEGEVARAADLAGRVIGPVMMLVMGVVIGLVVVLMYMPIFALTEVLQ